MRITIQHPSPVGMLKITEENGFITEISYPMEQLEGAPLASNPEGGGLLSLAKSNPPPSGFTPVLDLCIRELDTYFAKKLREFTVPVKATGTAFRELVWEELIKIPYGEKISYKELAKRIGNPAAIRAVGGANHHNPISIIIPCHRVIGANGKLVGYGGGIDAKKFLLELEG